MNKKPTYPIKLYRAKGNYIFALLIGMAVFIGFVTTLIQKPWLSFDVSNFSDVKAIIGFCFLLFYFIISVRIIFFKVPYIVIKEDGFTMGKQDFEWNDIASIDLVESSLILPPSTWVMHVQFNDGKISKKRLDMVQWGENVLDYQTVFTLIECAFQGKPQESPPTMANPWTKSTWVFAGVFFAVIVLAVFSV